MRYYYYLFYKFYKFGQWGNHPIPVQTRALIYLGSLEFMIQVSLFTYYGLLFGWDFDVVSVEFLGPLILITLFNFAFITFSDRWKNYFTEFDNWPVEKNNKGTWIVIGIVTFVVASFAYAIYLTPVPSGPK